MKNESFPSNIASFLKKRIKNNAANGVDNEAVLKEFLELEREGKSKKADRTMADNEPIIGGFGPREVS